MLVKLLFQEYTNSEQKERKIPEIPYSTDIAGHRAVFAGWKTQTIAKNLNEDVLTVES